jgi:hypothetical protein
LKSIQRCLILTPCPISNNDYCRASNFWFYFLRFLQLPVFLLFTQLNFLWYCSLFKDIWYVRVHSARGRLLYMNSCS